MAGIRSTKLETDTRVFEIQGWIINGVPDYLILKNIQKKYKNVNGEYLSRSQSKKLMQKAYSIWHQEQMATVEERRSLRIAELKQDIRSMGTSFKNTPQGMAVILNYKKEINKLEALYPINRLIIQGDKENPLIINTPEEREARIKELMAKIKK